MLSTTSAPRPSPICAREGRCGRTCNSAPADELPEGWSVESMSSVGSRSTSLPGELSCVRGFGRRVASVELFVELVAIAGLQLVPSSSARGRRGRVLLRCYWSAGDLDACASCEIALRKHVGDLAPAAWIHEGAATRALAVVQPDLQHGNAHRGGQTRSTGNARVAEVGQRTRGGGRSKPERSPQRNDRETSVPLAVTCARCQSMHAAA